VTSLAPTPLSLAAAQEMAGLLRQEPGSPQRHFAGYVDVLGKQDPLTPNLLHQFFRSKALPAIYERFWRPIVTRLAFSGRGMKSEDEHRIIRDMLGLSPTDRVLDVGCGPGNYTRDLAQRAKDGLVIGIDASETMVAAAVKRGGGANLAYVRGDALRLPFEDRTFDAVSCVGVIHMTQDPMATLDEMLRVLVPGGRLAMMATHGKSGSPRVVVGTTLFDRDTLTGALAERGCTEIEQRVIWRAQFLAASKPTG
jgi:SAM-dependent methyltransferase